MKRPIGVEKLAKTYCYASFGTKYVIVYKLHVSTLKSQDKPNADVTEKQDAIFLTPWEIYKKPLPKSFDKYGTAMGVFKANDATTEMITDKETGKNWYRTVGDGDLVVDWEPIKVLCVIVNWELQELYYRIVEKGRGSSGTNLTTLTFDEQTASSMPDFICHLAFGISETLSGAPNDFLDFDSSKVYGQPLVAMDNNGLTVFSVNQLANLVGKAPEDITLDEYIKLLTSLREHEKNQKVKGI